MKLVIMKHTIQYLESEARNGNIDAVNMIDKINKLNQDVKEKEKYLIFTVDNENITI